MTIEQNKLLEFVKELNVSERGFLIAMCVSCVMYRNDTFNTLLRLFNPTKTRLNIWNSIIHRALIDREFFNQYVNIVHCWPPQGTGIIRVATKLGKIELRFINACNNDDILYWEHARK